MVLKKDFLIITSVLLFAAGIFFRDTIQVFAAFSIILMLQADYFILRRKAGYLIDNLGYTRNSDKIVVVGDDNVSVNTTVDIKIPEGTEVIIEDLVPEGSVITGGTAESRSLSKSGIHRINYKLICSAHGTNRFEGIKISISDLFFSKQIILERPENDLRITVFPRPSFIKSGIPSLSGRSTGKKTIIQGHDIRGLRDYTSHDDVRIIDWKASAKYDKLIAREYSGLEKKIESIIIDLPDSEDPRAKEKTQAIRGLTGSVLMNRSLIENLNIIFISGPNIKEIIKSGRITKDTIDIINKINPVYREKYLYKFTPTVFSKNGIDDTFSAVLSKKARFFFGIDHIHIFEKQVYNILEKFGKGEEVFVITFPGSDISHLRIINEIAGIKKIRTACFIPETEEIVLNIKQMNLSGFSEVNII